MSYMSEQHSVKKLQNSFDTFLREDPLNKLIFSTNKLFVDKVLSQVILLKKKVFSPLEIDV